jgi:ceramide glucosyltransferase
VEHLALAVLACSAVASAYQLVQALAARRFLERARRAEAVAPAGHHPPVTILKPLRGPGVELADNLETFCRQDYPDYEIVFGVEDASDPAVAVVRSLERRFPHRRITLSVGCETGANRKVASLVHMMRHAHHDVLVLSDADIRVRPDYLRRLVAPLADPAVGLTTCLYRGRATLGLPSVLESLFINTDFVPMVMMAQWVQRFRYAYGASMAFRRAALEQIGGFGALRDHLADDYLLGNRLAAAGWRLLLLPYVVDTVLDARSLADVWRHQLRWARTYRVCQPVNWSATIIIHTVLWGTLAVLATGGMAIGWAALAIALAARLGSLRVVLAWLGDAETPRDLWLVPMKDLVYSGVWAASWLGRNVVWSGQRLRVLPDGRMIPLDELPVLAPEIGREAGANVAGPSGSC